MPEYLIKEDPFYRTGGYAYRLDRYRRGDIVAVDDINDVDGDGDVRAYLPGKGEWGHDWIDPEYLEPIEAESEPLAEWERELLTTPSGEFVLTLTEDELRALAEGSQSVSLRDKARDLLPPKTVTVELTEEEAQDLMTGSVLTWAGQNGSSKISRALGSL